MYSSHQALFVFAPIFVFVFVWRLYPRPSLSLLSSAPPSSKSFSPCGWLDRRYDQKNTLFVANTDFFISTTFLNISLLAGVTSPLLQLSAEACGWISQEAVSSKQRTQCKMVAPWWHQWWHHCGTMVAPVAPVQEILWHGNLDWGALSWEIHPLSPRLENVLFFYLQSCVKLHLMLHESYCAMGYFW